MTSFEALVELAENIPNPAIEEWRRQGNPVVGFLCSHIPEEILYAAGVLPYRLRAPNCVDTKSADVYMGHVNCTFVRSVLEYVFTGKYDFLDGYVFTNSCDHSRRFYDVMRETVDYPFMHLISLPHKVDGEQMALWYRDELQRLKSSVEQVFQVKISNNDLREAIETYNETRRLLRDLYEYRKLDKPPVSGTDTLNIVLAASSMPRGEYNKLLMETLKDVANRDGISDYRARLILAGSGCDNPGYYSIFEELGGLIVSDTHCFGSRYFWEPVPIEDDLLLGLAKAYLQRPSCAMMTDRVAERTQYIVDMASEYNADGVVYERIRYCDLWGGQLLYVIPKLKEFELPLLSLEREYALSSAGQLRTRAQAFLESIEGGREACRKVG